MLASAAETGGFSLLEVLIALLILGTAIVASIQGVSQGLRLLKLAGDQQQATVVADQKAREIIIPTESVESGSDGRFAWTRVTRVLETPELTPADAPQKWRVFEIAVAVTWDDERRVEVTTLRTVPATSDPTRDTTGSAMSGGDGTTPGTAAGLGPGTGRPGSSASPGGARRP